MNEELKLLANYMNNPNENIDIEYIEEDKLKELLEKKEVAKIYDILPKLSIYNSYYYIINKTKGIYITANENNDAIKKVLYSNIEPIKVDERILDIIYNYDNLPVYKRINGNKVKLLIGTDSYNDFSLIEWIGNYEPYVIVSRFNKYVADWLSGTYFNNLIDAVNAYYNRKIN